MKKVIFVIGLFLSSVSGFSQSESNASEKRLNYGFNIGINYSNLIAGETLPDNASISNNAGFLIGILADYTLSKYLSIAPKAALSFNNAKVNFTQLDGSVTEYEVLPISLDFMAHFIFKNHDKELSPYFFFGPNFKIPLSNNTSNSSTFTSGYDFALDFGIGVDKAFTRFHFAPELKYSFGFLNVNGNPQLQSLNFHSISLIINIFG